MYLITISLDDDKLLHLKSDRTKRYRSPNSLSGEVGPQFGYDKPLLSTAIRCQEENGIEKGRRAVDRKEIFIK